MNPFMFLTSAAVNLPEWAGEEEEGAAGEAEAELRGRTREVMREGEGRGVMDREVVDNCLADSLDCSLPVAEW